MSEFTVVRYHSAAWSELVEQGWVTMHTEFERDGEVWVRMIREPRPRRLW